MLQVDLMRALGLRSQSTVAGYENDTVEVSLSTALAIARTLGTTVAALVGEQADPNVDLTTTPNRVVIQLAGEDISDLDEHDRHELEAVVSYLAELRRSRRARGNPGSLSQSSQSQPVLA